MSTVVGPDGAGSAATLELRLPVATGSPDQVRLLAAAYQQLADDVASWVGRAVSRLQDLDPVWTGQGALACRSLVGDLDLAGGRVDRALRHCARELEDYARRLQAAHDDHGWSLAKLLTLGAVVVVTAGAVAVTLGGAAAVAGTVEAGEVAAAADGVSAATAAADAAAEQAAAGLLEGSRGLAELREMGRFLLPHLASAEVSGGMAALLDEYHSGRIDWADVAESAVAGLAGSAVSKEADLIVGGRLEAATPVVRRAGPYAVQAGLGAAGTAGQQLSEDQPVTGKDLLFGAMEGAGGAAVGRVREHGIPPPIRPRGPTAGRAR